MGKKLKVFEAFAGYGSQAMDLRNLNVNYEVVAISEIDKYAIRAYEAIHGETNNVGDISKVEIEDVPDHDLFTYSFPCTDISLAGNQLGLKEGSGTRSSLLWECKKIIEGKKPKFLLMENVKNLISKKHKDDFEEWINYLDEQGYRSYWKVLNSKDFGIPQSRERIFVVSIRNDIELEYEFPQGIESDVVLKDLLEENVDESYYVTTEKASQLISQYKGDLAVSCAIRSREFKQTGWKDECPSLLARDYKNPKNIIMPCITPDRINKRQNGRRFKEDSEPMFTLTTQDRHGILEIPLQEPLFKIRQATKQGFALAYEGDSINLEQPSSLTRRGRVGRQMANTLNTSNHQAVIQNYKIRRLTSRECFRLMGVSDSDIDKIQDEGISKSQQYKLAGNSIVVQVLEYIFKNFLQEYINKENE